MTKYKVRPGDTLGKIAAKFYGDPKRFPLIVAANSIANPDKLSAGQELSIPDATVAATAVGVTAATAAVSPPAAATVADRLAALTEKLLARVHPGLASRCRSMIELCAHGGVAIQVTQGLRTWQEQDALYAKGRTIAPIGKQFIVTNAKGGSSFHNFGLAFDIVVIDAIGKADWDATHPAWTRAAEIGKSVGLEWGGDWKSFKDRPHFQYTGGLGLVECRKLFPSGLEAIWAKVS